MAGMKRPSNPILAPSFGASIIATASSPWSRVIHCEPLFPRKRKRKRNRKHRAWALKRALGVSCHAGRNAKGGMVADQRTPPARQAKLKERSSCMKDGDPANPTVEELALTVEILERLTRRIDNEARKAVVNKRTGYRHTTNLACIAQD